MTPPDDERLEAQPGLTDIVTSVNMELSALLASAPRLQLRLTSTDSDSVLESVVPHFTQGTGPTLPSQRQGTGLVSLQSLLLLMQFGKARAETGQSFVMAVSNKKPRNLAGLLEKLGRKSYFFAVAVATLAFSFTSVAPLPMRLRR